MPYIFGVWLGIIEDEVHTHHFGDDGAIAEWVADGRHPYGDVAQDPDGQHIYGGHHQEIDVHIQDEGTRNDQVIQVWAAQFDQSAESRRYELNKSLLLQVYFLALK